MKPREVLKNIALGGATALALMLLFEGLCSTAMFVDHVIRSSAWVARKLGAVRQYTRYDSELGWVGIANLDLRDVYGHSKDVKTNSLGYRNTHEFDRPVPAGRIRILCSGDSFTFGHGVGNDETWCQALESQDARLQTVNAGERGYGVDQMFLRYRRDMDRLDINVHILAAIDNDFVRMLGKAIWDMAGPSSRCAAAPWWSPTFRSPTGSGPQSWSRGPGRWPASSDPSA